MEESSRGKQDRTAQHNCYGIAVEARKHRPVRAGRKQSIACETRPINDQVEEGKSATLHPNMATLGLRSAVKVDIQHSMTVMTRKEWHDSDDTTSLGT